MKLPWTIVFCVCFVQICFSSGAGLPDEVKNTIRTSIHSSIYGVSDQFVDDILFIHEECDEIVVIFVPLSMFEMGVGGKYSKKDVNDVKNYVAKKHSRVDRNEVPIGLELGTQIEIMKSLRLAMSAKLPPERYSGILNFYYVMVYPNPTTEEIQNVLDYVYGTGNPEFKDVVGNLPAPNATDCPQQAQKYAALNDELKSMTNIKPAVLHDAAAIIEKFPCDYTVFDFLKNFVITIEQYNINPVASSSMGYGLTREMALKHAELVLPSRLQDEVFRGMMNLEKATIYEPKDKIQKALEYAFIDVPILKSKE